MRYVLLLLMSFSAYGYDEVQRDIDRYQEKSRYEQLRQEVQNQRTWDLVDRNNRELRRKMERDRPCYSWQSRCD